MGRNFLFINEQHVHRAPNRQTRNTGFLPYPKTFRISWTQNYHCFAAETHCFSHHTSPLSQSTYCKSYCKQYVRLSINNFQCKTRNESFKKCTFATFTVSNPVLDFRSCHLRERTRVPHIVSPQPRPLSTGLSCNWYYLLGNKKKKWEFWMFRKMSPRIDFSFVSSKWTIKWIQTAM